MDASKLPSFCGNGKGLKGFGVNLTFDLFWQRWLGSWTQLNRGWVNLLSSDILVGDILVGIKYGKSIHYPTFYSN